MQTASLQPNNTKPCAPLTPHPHTRPPTHSQDEQAKRRQAERDFLELMSSIEEGAGDAQGGSSGDGGASLASRRLGELQVGVQGRQSHGV